jgi:hypothetical protein
VARDTSRVTLDADLRAAGNVEASARFSDGEDAATLPSKLLVWGAGALPTSVGTSTINSRMTNSVPPMSATQGVQRQAMSS